MRYAFLITILSLLFITCKKDSTDSAPVITYESISPNSIHSSITNNNQQFPILTIHIKDADGDLGLISGKDTSFIFIKNILTGSQDSLQFPDLSGSAKNFEGDVIIPLPSSVLTSDGAPTDTLYFQVYVKDFARQTSDTIITQDPVYFYTP
jgi:hypothetical protein